MVTDLERAYSTSADLSMRPTRDASSQLILE
jgi:hypothetical protein